MSPSKDIDNDNALYLTRVMTFIIAHTKPINSLTVYSRVAGHNKHSGDTTELVVAGSECAQRRGVSGVAGTRTSNNRVVIRSNRELTPIVLHSLTPRHSLSLL